MSETSETTTTTTTTTPSVVADHYDKKCQDNTDLASRAHSPIFHLRNFNNWTKSVLIGEFVKKLATPQNRNRHLTVLDLGCGKGGDIPKWKKSPVRHVTFADVSKESLAICRERYQSNERPPFAATFIHLDATRDLLADKLEEERQQVRQHDLVSSQFVLHYSFESFSQADRFLKNVSDSLRPGGFFVGTTTDGHEVVKRARLTTTSSDDNDTNSFGNRVYQVRFDATLKDARVPVALFGVKFDFRLDALVECPEFLVNFECLVEMARRHRLELVLRRPFDEFFAEKATTGGEYAQLITVMQALEPYYPADKRDGDKAVDASEYEYIESRLHGEDGGLSGERLRSDEAFATLSKAEWEVATLYLVFAFVKLGDEAAVDEAKKEVGLVEESGAVEEVRAVEDEGSKESATNVEEKSKRGHSGDESGDEPDHKKKV